MNNKKSVGRSLTGAVVMMLAICMFAVVLTGCNSTQSVITEYDAAGNLVKKTETSESVVKEVTASTKNKTVVVWESGWAAYISASTATTQDPTPTMKMFAGKTDKGLINALPDQQDWAGIASVVSATKYDLNLSATGVSNSSSKVGDETEKDSGKSGE